ncbi:sigma-70 family RNA polymerase sigma factor [Pelagicoccus sp. NFK12]|uniref:Sigma-70 family RNA polymerase sigma factor n=1 Tax=Pelagicoccus enzymogenes TaxID=2773457 RepID=A0A927IDU9_9BACT|nr:sigma-70 family RNA polymerase sigma factor [Pelagicoccus enzymogenes]MBD5778362.1 sigma-70 family RNA polymerase sigma factor [Pelagicoccus enzymogenes]MDQ8201197.1 sigma-70 family RNA polymerase sigma factor [Pelagicoccus enzymogenes]
MHDTTKTQSKLSPRELLRAATRFALSLTRNHSDAEDLAQIAWMKLQKKYGSVDNRRLLFVAIRNTHFDQLRRTRVVSFSPLESAPEPSRSETPGHSLDLETTLSTLSEAERTTLQLNIMEGYTAIQIGEKLGMPRGTVLSHMSRARSKLRKAFGPEFGALEGQVA